MERNRPHLILPASFLVCVCVISSASFAQSGHSAFGTASSNLPFGEYAGSQDAVACNLSLLRDLESELRNARQLVEPKSLPVSLMAFCQVSWPVTSWSGGVGGRPPGFGDCKFKVDGSSIVLTKAEEEIVFNFTKAERAGYFLNSVKSSYGFSAIQRGQCLRSK